MNNSPDSATLFGSCMPYRVLICHNKIRLYNRYDDLICTASIPNSTDIVNFLESISVDGSYKSDTVDCSYSCFLYGSGDLEYFRKSGFTDENIIKYFTRIAPLFRYCKKVSQPFSVLAETIKEQQSLISKKILPVFAQ